MTEWREVTLGDALRVRHGFAFKGEYFRDDGKLIVLTPGNFIEAGGFKPKSGSEKYYDGPVPNGYLLKKGDVLVAMTEQSTGLLGSSATIPASDRFLHNQRLGLLQVTAPEMLDQRFAYHVMNTPVVRQQIQATATGTKVRHTAPERIQAIRVALPSLRAQRVIAGILDAMDDLIENNRRRIQVLEEIARAIYREWFVHFRYPGNGGSAPSSLLRGIPDQWTVTTLGEVANLDRTSVQPVRSPEESFDHYSIPAFDEGQLPAVDAGSTIKSGKFLVALPSVLVSKLNPRIERTWFVQPGGNRRSVASTEFLVLRPGGLATLEWLYLTIGSESFQQRLRELSGGTSTSHQRAKPDDFLAIATLLPPTDVITRFTGVVAPGLALARLLRVENRRMPELRDLLLPALVTGRIDVSSLDLEPLVEDSVA